MEAQQLLMFSAKIILSLVLGGSLVLFAHLTSILLLHPRKLRSKLQSQGIKGPSPSFLYGNLLEIKKIQLQNQKQPRPETNNQEIEGSIPLFHTWPATVFSHIKQWQLEYGQILALIYIPPSYDCDDFNSFLLLFAHVVFLCV